jgi:hypothetical protein
MTYGIEIGLPAGREIKCALLEEDTLDILVELIKARAPGIDLKDMEFYAGQVRLCSEDTLRKQNLGDDKAVSVIPANCVGPDFPSLIITTVWTRFWDIKPTHIWPIYLRVLCELQPRRELLIETHLNEEMSKVKSNAFNCWNSLNSNSRTSWLSRYRLMIGDTDVDEKKTVKDYDLTSGSRIRMVE